MPDDATKATYRRILAIDPATGGATLGDPFEAVRQGPTLIRDGVGIDGEEARYLVRCTDAGRPLIHMAAPMHIQYEALRANEAATEVDLSGHLADLSALRAAIGGPDAAGIDPAQRADAHLYDAALTGVRDTQLPQHVVDAWTEEDTRKPPGVDPVIRKIEEDTGIDEGEWMRVVDLGPHRNEQIRAMARQMLRPVLGNSAQLEDLRLLLMPPSEVERAGAVSRWVRDSGDVRELQPFTTELMKGYRTSTPMLAERDGVTLLMFSDFAGTYAYAWQTDPDTAPKIRAEPEEKPYPFNLIGPG